MTKATIATVTKMVLLAELIPDAEHLARHSAESVEQLSGDMAANGLHQAIGVLEDRRIIYGHGRYAAAKRLGWREIEAKIYPASLSETQWRIIRACENLQRTDVSGFQKWQTVMELLRINPAWTQKDVAMNLHLSEAMIVRLLSPSRCIGAVQEALKAGKMGITDCYAISKLPQAQQAEALSLKLSGASRDAIEEHARKRRNGNGAPAVRMDRIKIAMPQGASIVISGSSLGMGEVVDLLSEVLKDAKKAAETFDVRTWVKMMADKAK